MNYLILIIVGIVGGWIGYWIAISKKERVNVKIAAGKKGFGAYNAKKQKKKEQAKRKIIEFLERRGRVGNNDVERLLGVSDATATNYLQELENEVKIEQIGREGRSVYYTLK